MTTMVGIKLSNKLILTFDGRKLVADHLFSQKCCHVAMMMLALPLWNKITLLFVESTRSLI